MRGRLHVRRPAASEQPRLHPMGRRLIGQQSFRVVKREQFRLDLGRLWKALLEG